MSRYPIAFCIVAVIVSAALIGVSRFTDARLQRQETLCRQHSGVLVLATRGEYACVLGAK